MTQLLVLSRGGLAKISYSNIGEAAQDFGDKCVSNMKSSLITSEMSAERLKMLFPL